MKVLILAQKFDNYSIQKLDCALKSRGHSVLMVTPSELAVKVGNNSTIIHNNDSLSGVDVALLRCSGFTPYTKNVARVLEFHIGVQLGYSGTICVNEPEAKRKAQDKFYTLQILNRASVPVPESFLIWDTNQFNHIVEKTLDIPIIIKLAEGTWGVGVMRADSLESARSVFESIRGMGHVTTTQKYIDYEIGRDIRVIIVNGKVAAAMSRIAQSGEFRSNVHQGGKSIKTDLQDECAEIAIEAAKALGLGIAGVDIIESDAGPQVIEVNPTPGLEGIEKTTGIDVAKLIVEYLEDLANSIDPA